MVGIMVEKYKGKLKVFSVNHWFESNIVPMGQLAKRLRHEYFKLAINTNDTLEIFPRYNHRATLNSNIRYRPIFFTKIVTNFD